MKWLSYIVLLAVNAAFSQSVIKASADKSEAYLNDKIRVTFETTAAIDSILAPRFDKFEIVAGPAVSVSRSIVNNKPEIKKTYTYFLAPLEEGKLGIGAASAEYNGNMVYSNPIEININGYNAEAKGEYAVFMKTEVANPMVSKGDTILVKHWLYQGAKARVTNVSMDKVAYEGFSVANAERISDAKPMSEKNAGVDYDKKLLQTVKLVSLRAGNFELAPIETIAKVKIGTGKSNIERTITLSGNTETVFVNP